jgi:2-desacetyl-2-hydroxyethyl bacteriochlorophyllide A dehydrogenase
MKAVVLEKPGEFRAITIDEPRALRDGEALVRVHRVGVCGTDLHAFRGTQPFFNYPRILGHELGVEILSVAGADSPITPGDRCAVLPGIPCERCIACRRGKPNCCVDLKLMGVHMDGGMCERMIVPVKNLFKSPKLSLEELAVVEPLCIGRHAVRRAAPEAGDTVLIIGAGPIGLAVAQSIPKNVGALLMMDISDERLAFARDKMGIRHCVDGRGDAPGKVTALLGGELATIVIDCTGSKQSMESSLNYMAHGGKLVFVGLFTGDFMFNDPLFQRRETTLMSSRNATGEDFRDVIRRMENGEIDVRHWITHRVRADEVIGAFPGWVSGTSGLIKATIEW